MQELISQVEELGIEINHTTSLVMIFGIIFITAIIVHVILHWVVLRAFEKRANASSRLWLQIITQNKLFLSPAGIHPAGYHCQYTGRTLVAERQ